mmetsp:Transcript_40832/g.108220  ORF Transcript_40832/g.108220 Transcript_40832/m.108220 type:complete len:155 (-) Transcript_40832:188-652(-)
MIGGSKPYAWTYMMPRMQFLSKLLDIADVLVTKVRPNGSHETWYRQHQDWITLDRNSVCAVFFAYATSGTVADELSLDGTASWALAGLVNLSGETDADGLHASHPCGFGDHAAALGLASLVPCSTRCGHAWLAMTTPRTAKQRCEALARQLRVH